MKNITILFSILFAMNFAFCEGLSIKTKPTKNPPYFVVSINGKQGYINPEGKIALEAKFQKAYPFKEGLATVQIDGKWGYINAKGEIVIKPRFAMAGFFSDGLASYRDTYESQWGYINTEGKVIIKPGFDSVEEFHNGIARVGIAPLSSRILSRFIDGGVQVNYHFINKKGEKVDKPKDLHYSKGKTGELILFVKNNKTGYLNSKGEVIIKPIFEAGLPFSEGLACVRHKGKYGYIDSSGKFVIFPRFMYPNSFSEGLAGVPLDKKKWGFINKKGETVIEAQYAWIYDSFKHGIIAVAKDKKLGYINTKNEWVWKPSQ